MVCTHYVNSSMTRLVRSWLDMVAWTDHCLRACWGFILILRLRPFKGAGWLGESFMVIQSCFHYAQCVGMEWTEKIRGKKGIGYTSWYQDRVRVGFLQCGLAKLLTIFQSFLRDFANLQPNDWSGSNFHCRHSAKTMRSCRKWWSEYGINS